MISVQTMITICGILISGGTIYGVMITRIKALEAKVEKTAGDHDLLIVLNTKMDLILKGWKDKKKC